jgi:hypothetical protein
MQTTFWETPMKTFTTKILMSLAVLALTLGSLTAGEKKGNKSSSHCEPSKPSCHEDKCHDKSHNDCHWPKFPWWPHCDKKCDKKCPPCDRPGTGTTPPGPGTGTGTNPNPGDGGVNRRPPVGGKVQFRVEHEYKQGYGFDNFPVTVVGTYNTRAEAEAAAQTWNARGFTTRIIEVPVRNPITGDITPIRPGDLRGIR